jgi:hypothetical protein
MSDDEVDALLCLVRTSAERIEPDELEFYDDYAAEVRARKQLPPEVAPRTDGSETRVITTGILVGIGISFLGQVGSALLKEVINRAVKQGVDSAAQVLKGVKKGTEPETTPVETKSQIADAVIGRVNLPPGVSREEAHRVVQLQIELIEDQPEITQKLLKP